MSESQVYLYILLLIGFTGIFYDPMRNLVESKKVVRGFVVVLFVTFLVWLIKKSCWPGIPWVLVGVFIYSFGGQYLLYVFWVWVYGRGPRYNYLNMAKNDLLLTPDQFYPFFPCILGLIPAIIYASLTRHSY